MTLKAAFGRSSLRLRPDRSGQLPLHVRNDGPSPTVVALEVVGEPAAWAGLHPATFHLAPSSETTSLLQLDLPDPSPERGDYTVRVLALAPPGDVVELAQASIKVRRSVRVRPLVPAVAAAAALAVVVSLVLTRDHPVDTVSSTLDPRPTPTTRAEPSASSVAVRPGATALPSATVPSSLPSLLPVAPPSARPQAATVGRVLATAPGAALSTWLVRADGTDSLLRSTAPPTYGPYGVLATVAQDEVLLLRGVPVDQPVVAQLCRVTSDGSVRVVREVSSEVATYGYTSIAGMGNRWLAMYKASEGFLAAQRFDESGNATGKTNYPLVSKDFSFVASVGEGRVLLYNKRTGESLAVVMRYEQDNLNTNQTFRAQSSFTLPRGLSAAADLGDGRLLLAGRTAVLVTLDDEAGHRVTDLGPLPSTVTHGAPVGSGQAVLVDDSGAGVLARLSDGRLRTVPLRLTGRHALLTTL